MMINKKLFYLFIMCGTFLFLVTGCFKIEDEKGETAYVDLEYLMKLHPGYIKQRKSLDLSFEKNILDAVSSETVLPDIKTSLSFDEVPPFETLPIIYPLIYENSEFINANISFIESFYIRDIERFRQRLEIQYADEMQSEIIKAREEILMRTDEKKLALTTYLASQIAASQITLYSVNYTRNYVLRPGQTLPNNDLIREEEAKAFLASYQDMLLQFDLAGEHDFIITREEIISRYNNVIAELFADRERKNILDKNEQISLSIETIPLTIQILDDYIPPFYFYGLSGGTLYYTGLPEPENKNFKKNRHISAQLFYNDNNIIKKETIDLVNSYAKRYNYIISEKNDGKNITADVESWLKNIWSKE